MTAQKSGSAQKVLDSAVYKTELEQVVSAILKKCELRDSESTIASVFENELYHFIKVQFGIDIKFNKESGKNYFRHEFQGRIDAISNGFVIEYKRQTKLQEAADQNKAITQISDYLTQLENHGKVCNGVLTDGRRACFFYWRKQSLRHSGFTTIGTASLDKIVRFLIGSEEKAFTSENILSDFTLKDKRNPTYELSQVLYGCVQNNASQRTEMLYREWLSLFHLSEMDKGKNKDIAARKKVLGEFFNSDLKDNDQDYKALFALQTAYALVIKLIACKAIGRLAYDNDIQYFGDLTEASSDDLLDFFMKLEDGYVFKAGGVLNLLEGDYFSWYSSPEQWSVKLATPIRKIISQVELYSTNAESRLETADIFKDLYMDFIPQEVRHSLGEYYTPDWLVDHIVDEAISRYGDNDTWTGIDPCCGSGIFVLKMVDRIVADKDSENICESDRVKLLDELQHRVIGIDINPLSALTSRVNYFLAISRFIHPGDNVEIPIYVGDSAVMPKRITMGMTECYQYVIETTFAENGENKEIEATLPVSFVENDTFLQTMDNIQTYVKSDNADVLNDFLIDSIGSVATDPEIQTAVRSFAETLTELHRNNWDGIWVRIVSNFMLIARISSRDIIVGNPPWVKWEYLPEHYAKKLKDACFERDMFSGQSYMGAISLNICAAIAIMTASAWLSQDGVLAFLMPRNLLTQDSYEGFRNFKLAAPRAKERLFLQYVEQWPTNGLFGEGSVEPCATFYYQSKRIDYSTGVSVSSYTKLRGKDLHSSNRWNAASKNFSIKNDLAVQLDSRRTGFTIVPNDDSKLITNLKLIVGTSDYKGRTGVEFVPEEVTFIKPVAQSSKEGQWVFKGMKMKRSIHKVSTDEEFILETKFVRPLINLSFQRESN